MVRRSGGFSSHQGVQDPPLSHSVPATHRHPNPPPLPSVPSPAVSESYSESRSASLPGSPCESVIRCVSVREASPHPHPTTRRRSKRLLRPRRHGQQRWQPRAEGRGKALLLCAMRRREKCPPLFESRALLLRETPPLPAPSPAGRARRRRRQGVLVEVCPWSEWSAAAAVEVRRPTPRLPELESRRRGGVPLERDGGLRAPLPSPIGDGTGIGGRGGQCRSRLPQPYARQSWGICCRRRRGHSRGRSCLLLARACESGAEMHPAVDGAVRPGASPKM